MPCPHRVRRGAGGRRPHDRLMPPVVRLLRTARRLSPVALEAYRRWQAMTPEERDRYRQMARGYADRGRTAVDRARERRRRGR